jgi:hypothetical protein
MMPLRYIMGMHGLGDNLHQRAVVRQLMQRHPQIILETPWPCVYHDLVGPKLGLMSKHTVLRTQVKNATREHSKYTHPAPMMHRYSPDIALQVSYTLDEVRRTGSVLGGMLMHCQLDLNQFDFRLPIPQEWHARADAWLERWKVNKPLMIYRPLVERREWAGCAARNPEFVAYAMLYKQIRERFFVVSVADLVPRIEWMVGAYVPVDVECHAGELDFEVIAALTSRAALVYCSPGFAVVLAQAVECPSICVFGGYENGTSYSLGARLAPHLAIEPIKPCQCFQHNHNCQKAIDFDKASKQVEQFLASI